MADEKKDEPPKRPEPPKSVDTPLPHLAEAMKKLGEMQVSITAVVDELDKRRQEDYIRACKEFDNFEANKKAKELADKEKAEYASLKWEVARLKRKLEQRPGKPDPETHAMAIERVINNVLRHDDFDKANLKNFCLICKAWVVPCRTRLFLDLSNLIIKSRQRCDGLVELFISKKSFGEVVKTISFQFAPPDPSSPRQLALRESLPSPIQMMLLLSAAVSANKLEFLNMAVFGATQAILKHYCYRIEFINLDPQGYAWHGKEVEFGLSGERALFADWPALRELSLCRVVLKIENNRDRHGEHQPATCPLTSLKLEKVRVHGWIHHMLEGSLGKLTHLNLRSVGSLMLADVCQVMAEHGATLTHLTLIGCDLLDHDPRSGYQNGWNQRNSNDPWGDSQRATGSNNGALGTFDRAMEACVSLTHLSIEPGRCPVLRPNTLFQGLTKLEDLQFTKKNCNTYDRDAWMSLLGLGPVLLEGQRKLKKISFGFDWNSDDPRLQVLNTQWKQYSEEVKMARLT